MALYDDLISPDLRIRNARSELDENYLFDPANEIPNAETIAALQEYEEMMKHPERYKKYKTFKEAMADVLSEETEDSSDPFYSESNTAHILRGIAALDAGKGTEHELLDPDLPLAEDEMDDETFKAMMLSRFEEVKRGESRPLDEVFAELRSHISSPDCLPSREDALDAFHALRAQATANFPNGLTLEEINDEINNTRNGIPD